MMRRYTIKAFTLIEVVIASTGFFILVTIVTGLFIEMVKVKGGLDARQNLVKESYHLVEKLQVLSKNYTIDYEEYRNRKNVGCNLVGDEMWADGCSMMTYYGNRNLISPSIDSTYNILYYCSSVGGVRSFSPPVVEDSVSEFPCIPPAYVSNSSGFYQGYGQYKATFLDVKGDVDAVFGAVNDDDDDDRGYGPEAIFQSTGVQELYLISHDATSRVFLRRKLIEEGDWNNNGIIGDINSEKRFALQILKLKGIDAGFEHDFSEKDSYDGVIDTRACDTGLGFICSGREIGGAYAGYYLPEDGDDGRVNISAPDITISDWNIIVYPSRNPKLSRQSSLDQISPHIYINLSTNLYGKSWISKIPGKQIEMYNLRLQTMLSLPIL